ncbi:MAM and LDL-receptor class A domain-containing protein 1 isoform X2 [Colossoma macropomum]|uniref:MAM and LDL-receptor class A domain-containing protein 1 isoform X2 n=1 Tax=Colossoma macropomum TaxID=42526 RepID=UPI001864008F|nr:MAM and LDL-receptor class A domain-containing protein 1 isoform X2 [Colossoma macropomum]
MSGHTQLWLLVVVAWLCVFNKEAYASSIALHESRSNAALIGNETAAPLSVDSRALSQPGGANNHPVCRIDCDFEKDLCTWNQLLTDVFDWTRHSGSTPTSMTGPSFDHTTGSGHYIYIEGDSATHGDTARLVSKECSDRQPQCLQFWYHIYGSSWTMGLDLYLLHGNDAREVWRLRESKGNTWYRALVPLIPRGNFQVIFEGRRGDNARSDVAIDDISLHRGTCEDLLLPPLPDSNHPVCRINCNFEKDLCTWNQYLADVFDWTRHSGSTPTPLTGPSSDHTTGSGHYVYIEGDSATQGDTARLVSEECSDRQPQCLQFWYHMYGSSWTMGLTVYLMYGNHPREVWRLREDKGNTWHRALVNLTPQGNFKIIFEGRRGADARSDIAVDDVSLHRGTCEDLLKSIPTPSKPEHPIISTPVSIRTTTPHPSKETTTVKSQNTDSCVPEIPNTPTPAAATPPSIVSTISPKRRGANNYHPVCRIDCDFEKDLCTWNQLLADVFDWTRHSGSTPTLLTGPSSDHTTGSGHYIYIEGDSATHGDTARLLSKECSDRQPQCLQFWYHMYGSSWTMGLTVYLLHGNEAREVWRQREGKGNTWHRALVNLIPEGNFKIIFEGRRGDDARSDVAVDDISLHRGTCEDLFPTIPPQNDHPVCRINCNFENELCTWHQIRADVFDWTRHSGSTPTAFTGPSSDHTNGSGHYIYIEGDSATHGDTARLLSEECTDQQPQCLQFWYHMYGSSWTMGLTVYLLHGNQAQEVWRQRENKGNIWHRALVDLTPQGNFKIIFEGRRGANAWSDVAVDDISLHRGSCKDLINLPHLN